MNGWQTSRTQGEQHISYWAGSGYKGSFVYVLSAPPLSGVKIGYTSSSIKSRMASLQTGCPVPLRCLYALPAEQRLETWLHRHLNRSRIAGEWFDGPAVPPVLQLLESTAIRMVADHDGSPQAPHYWIYTGWLPSRGGRPTHIPRSEKATGWEDGTYRRYLDPQPLTEEQKLEQLRAHWMRKPRPSEQGEWQPNADAA